MKDFQVIDCQRQKGYFMSTLNRGRSTSYIQQSRWNGFFWSALLSNLLQKKVNGLNLFDATELTTIWNCLDVTKQHRHTKKVWNIKETITECEKSFNQTTSFVCIA